MTPRIIDYDGKCRRCGLRVPAINGLCLRCARKLVEEWGLAALFNRRQKQNKTKGQK